MSEVKINDFVVRFANVNGTGSASANALFTKAVFKMGVPATPKNIFPSNIQGLPTWYEVRVSEKGYLGRREGVDFMVSVNPQSMKKDVADTKSGGYFLYDSTKPLHDDYIRNDINYIGVPLMELSNANYTDSRQRQLFKNIIYVGALSALFDIPFDVFEGLIGTQFKRKEKLIEPNIKALRLGADYIRANFECPIPLRVEPRDLVGNSIIMTGNSACALGAIYGGATVAAWYPITPSTSVVDAFTKYCERLRIDQETGKKNFAIVQAEDELAAIGMVVGANWNGARSFTATSGPGLSLMNEFLGLAYFAEIPCVLIDVQRTGPSTGMPTRTQQSDVLEAAYASHGDTKHVLLFPSSPKECFEMTAEAFDLTERLQTPVIVMTDLDLGMNEHISPPLVWNDERRYDRGKVLTEEELESMPAKYGRYLDVDGDGIPMRTIPATHPTKGAFVTRGSSRNSYAAYTEDSAEYVANMERLEKKFETAAAIVPKPEIKLVDGGSKTGVIYYGTSTYATEEAVELLTADGIRLDEMHVKAFPFGKEVVDFVNSHERVFVIEQNRDAQLRSLMMIELGASPDKLIPVLNYDGMPITADFIASEIRRNC